MCKTFSTSLAIMRSDTGVFAGTNGTANGSTDGGRSPDNFEALDKEALIKQLRKVGSLPHSYQNTSPSPSLTIMLPVQHPAGFWLPSLWVCDTRSKEPKASNMACGCCNCMQQSCPQPLQAILAQLLPRCNTASKLLSLDLLLGVLLPMPCLSTCAEQLSVNWQHFEIAKLHGKPHMHCLR